VSQEKKAVGRGSGAVRGWLLKRKFVLPVRVRGGKDEKGPALRGGMERERESR